MSVKKSTTKTKRAAATELALRSGKEWAQLFLERARKNPNDYALQGWTQDAESAFGDNPHELDNFYMTIQGACLRDSLKAVGTMSREALECHLAGIEDRISKAATVLVMGGDFAQGEINSDGGIDSGARRMVADAMEMADEQLVAANAAIALLKAEAGIKEAA